MTEPEPDRAGDDRAGDDRSGGDRPTSLRFAGAGMELAGMVLVCGFLGHLLDRYVLPGMDVPWGLLGGGMLGFAAGMSHLFVLAKKYNR